MESAFGWPFEVWRSRLASRKHHYLPKCYLRAWTGSDGRLCEYSRPYGKVVAKRRHPSETGWEWELYSVPGSSAPDSDRLETHFMRRVDQGADVVLRRFLAGEPVVALEHRTQWSRFLMSLLQRSPRKVAELKERATQHYLRVIDNYKQMYDAAKAPDAPDFEEMRKATDAQSVAELGAAIIGKVSDLPMLGQVLNNMRWTIVSLQDGSHTLLTSDYPVVMSNGLKYRDSNLVLPISPQHVFVATNNEETYRQIEGLLIDPKSRSNLNSMVVEQAASLAYGVDDKQLRFVANRLPATKPAQLS